MPKLDDLFDVLDLEAAIAAGYVREQTHPTLPLRILNYTDQTTWDRVWTPVTRQCRGLIVDDTTGEIVARPWKKFFNHGEPSAPVLDLDAPCIVTDKADGSLGILYPTGNSYAIATRGSFLSEQAIHATEVWTDRYAGHVTPEPGWTYLFEIVYPTNRIVVDYRGLDDLILLGAVHIDTGLVRAARDIPWPGPRIEEFPHATLADALAADPRPGMEGFVIRYSDGDMVKIKQAEYVALHRILTGVTARTLWEFLAVHACIGHTEQGKRETTPVDFLVRKLQLAPDRIREILAAGPEWQTTYMQGVPEEFRAWVSERVADLQMSAEMVHQGVQARFHEVSTRAQGQARGEFVAAAREHAPECWQQLMSLLDGRQIETWIWGQVRPDHERPFRSVSEAVA